MTEEVTSIGIGLQTDGIERGVKALDTLAAQGPKVESSMKGIESAAVKTGKSLETLGQGGAASSLGKLGGAATTAARDISQIDSATAKAGRGLEGMGSAAQLAAKAVASIGIATAVREYLQAADAITTLNNSLKLSTGSTQAAAAAYEDLYAIAQRSRVSFVELGNTYSSIARATGDLGVSQARMLKVTQSIANAMTIGGGSAQSMQAALVQLSQGMASGTLRGEELNSILEQAPRLAKALADGLNVPIGKLREMGQAGEITSQQIIKALESQADVLSKEVTGATITLGQAFTQLTNAGTKAVGEFDKAAGASTALAQAISSVAGAVDTMGAAFANNAGAVQTVMGALAGAAALTTLAAIPRAIAAVTGAVTGLGAVLAANPLVLTLLGVGAVVGGGIAAVNAYSKTADGIKSAVKSLEEANQRSEAALQRAMDGGRNAGADNIRKAIEERKKAIRELNAELALMSNAGLDNRAEEARLAAGTEQMQKQKREAEELAGIKQKLSGVDKDYLPTLNKLFAQYQAGNIEIDEYRRLVTKLAQNNYKPEKQAAGLKAEQNAYESLISSINAKIEADKLELAGGAALTESQRIRVKLDQDLAAGRVKLSAQHERAIRLALEELKVSEASVIAAKAIAKASQAAADARNKEAEGITAWLQAQEDAARQAVQSVTGRVAALQDEEDAVRLAASLNIGLAEAVERVALARLKEKQAGFHEGSEGWENIEREIKAREKLIGMVGGKEMREAAAEANKQMQLDFERSIERYDDIFRQGFADMLNNGKDGWKSFTKSLATTFKTTVADTLYKAFAQPFVVRIVGQLLGLTGALGLGGGAGGGGGLLGTALQGAQLYQGLTGGTGLLGGIGSALGLGAASAYSLGGAAALGASTGVAAGGGLGLSLTGGGLGISAPAAGYFGGVSSGVAGGAAASGGGMSGALASIPGWGWALAGLAALAAIFGKKSTPHMGAASTYSESGGLVSNADIYRSSGLADTRTYNAEVAKVTGGVAKGVADTLNATARAFGKTAGYEITTAFADDKSKDGAWGSLIIRQAGKSVIDWRDTQTSKWAPKEFADGEAGQKEYMAAIAKSTREALDAMDLPGWADDMLNALGETPSLEGLASTVESINAASAALDTMGKNLVGFAGLTDEAISALVKASGGLAGLISNASTFYDNFYSPEEKKDRVKRDISDKLSKVGIDGIDFDDPKAREKYRKLVEDSMAKSDEQAKNRKALADTFIGAAGKGGKSLSDLIGGDGWAGLDPNLFGKDDPEARKKLEGFMKDVDKVVSSGKSPAEIEASVSSLVKMNSEVLGLGEDAAATTAALLEASGAFASVTQSAEQVRAEAQASALSSLQRAVDAEKRLLDARIDARIDAASTAVSELSGLFGLLHDNVRSLYGEVDSTAAMMAAQGNAFIAQALSAARSTGYLPEQAQLNDAISAARGGIGATQYATQFEADRARLVLAGQLSELEGMAGEQLGTAERTLKELQAQSDQLDQTMQYWRDQIELSQAGVDATLSVADAVAHLEKLMFPDAEKPADPAGSGGSGFVIGGGGGGGGAPAKPGSGFYGAGGTEINDPAAVARLTSIRAYTNTLDFSAANKADSVAALADAAKQYGVSISEIAIANGYRQEDVAALLDGYGLPRFERGGLHAGGLRLVGERGWEIEATGPARYWNQQQLGQALSGSGNTARLEALVEVLTERVESLQRELSAIRGNTGGLPQLVDQFDNVTSGGNAMREVVA